MESFKWTHSTTRRLAGDKPQTLVGVVASGNLEVLAQRVLDDTLCEIDIATSIKGYRSTWEAVAVDFVERYAPGGIRFSINDSGARPDTVILRLAQACQALGANG